MQSIASIPTTSAARYMTQLCKHWAHKFPVTFDAATGQIDLPAGLCLLTAGPESLGVVLEAEDEAGLLKLEDVVARHVSRFAFREGELAFAWTRTVN